VANLTIGKKLFLGIGALVLLTVALGTTSLIGINSVNEHLQTVVDSTVKEQNLTRNLAADAAELAGITRGMVIRGITKDDAGQQSNIQAFSEVTERADATIEALNAMNLKPEIRQDLADIKQGLDTIRPAKDAILDASKTPDNTTAAVAILDQTVRPAQKRMEASINDMLKVQDGLLVSDSEAATAAVSTSRWIDIFVLLLAVVVAMTVAFAVRRINAVLASSVHELDESSDQIAAAASQVSSSSQSLAQGSSEQAATIEETSSVSVEINSMAQRNTENSRQTASIVTDSEGGFQKANNSLSEMVVAMEGISTSSQKISKIIKVIDEIAFQTNILALNAAVEAARAGEAGMGFAVVADEVRNLAQRCAQAAKDTTELIEDSIERSDSGMNKVDQVAVAIREITAQSAQIRTLVDEINLGSIEQSRGIDQISTSIGQMEQVTQSSAANAEETAAAAEQLSAQAKAMKDVVTRLRAMVQSDDSQPSALRSSASQHRSRPAVSLGAHAAGKLKSTSSSPRPNVRTHVSASVTTKPKQVAAGAFPMDDDFKEF
jgi:methyl-accepting chemotaxis protein/methyl-accepting chemotaxis protein-1 (serine sensor receptor)